MRRPARSLKTKKPPDSGKTGNEGIRRVLLKTDQQAGSILLFAEKCSESFGTDERSQTGILTLASDLFPPSRSLRTSGIGNCSHYSGATVPDLHRVPRHVTALSGTASARFKERIWLYLDRPKSQAEFRFQRSPEVAEPNSENICLVRSR